MQEIKFTSAQDLMIHFLGSMINIEVFKTAFKLGIFEILKSGFKSIEELKSILNLKIPSRNLYDYFDKLTILGLLDRQGIEETALYKNSQSTNVLFLKESPQNILSLYYLSIDIQQCLFNLDEYLRQRPDNMNDQFSKFISNKESARVFLHSMKQMNEKKFDLTIENLPSLKDYKSCVDIGGALGVLSSKLKTKFPELKCFSMDLPLISDLAKEYLKNEGLLEKVELLNGDLFKDEWPKTDVVFICNVFLDWDYENKIKILKKAYDSLNEGGMLVCEEEFIDDNREKQTKGINISMIMIVHTTGYNCTPKEFDRLAKLVGFKKTEYLNNGVEFCIAYK